MYDLEEIRTMSIRNDTMRFFEGILLDFFRKAGREYLPWRKKGVTAYEVWVSEIMLQQTQVSRVIGYYNRFLERFPTIETLAAASWEEFLPYYEGLGYYARGRNMLETARRVVERFSGAFPKEQKELESLPGIGPYTAAALRSFAYGQPALAWDTNLRRVVGRFFFGSKMAEGVYGLGDRFHLKAKDLNAALMDFGSSLCSARPKCNACPLASRCRYRREKGKQESATADRRPVRSGLPGEKTYIILHERHRHYFSEHTETYMPFILPEGYIASRSGIKAWFQERYGLTVSVRPPKRDPARGIVLVNTQILSGKSSFSKHPKSEYQRFLGG